MCISSIEGPQVDLSSSPADPDAFWVGEMTSLMRNVLSVLSRTSFIKQCHQQHEQEIQVEQWTQRQDSGQYAGLHKAVA